MYLDRDKVLSDLEIWEKNVSDRIAGYKKRIDKAYDWLYKNTDYDGTVTSGLRVMVDDKPCKIISWDVRGYPLFKTQVTIRPIMSGDDIGNGPGNFIVKGF